MSGQAAQVIGPVVIAEVLQVLTRCPGTIVRVGEEEAKDMRSMLVLCGHGVELKEQDLNPARNGRSDITPPPLSSASPDTPTDPQETP